VVVHNKSASAVEELAFSVQNRPPAVEEVVEGKLH
jgi:hypothetical protein